MTEIVHRLCAPDCSCVTERRVAFGASSLAMYVVTHGTRDFGELYVVRLHEIGQAVIVVHRRTLIEADTLDEARSRVPAGLERVPMCDGLEDPVVVEAWW